MTDAPKKTSKPLLIAIGGISGSGKTTAADSLALTMQNAVHLDSDRIRKEICGVSETTALPQEAYGWPVTERMIAQMTLRTKEALAAGKSVIVSSVLSSPRAREDQERIAAECNAQFVGIWLETELKTIFGRVATRTNNPSDAGIEVVKKQAERYSRPKDWIIIDAGRSKQEVAANVAAAVIKQTRTGQVPARPRIQP
jgi:predicted kinase